MKIALSDDRRTECRDRLQSLFREKFEEELSDFRATEILDLFLVTLCPVVYNQAVQDVRSHFQVRLDDLEGEVYADPET